MVPTTSVLLLKPFSWKHLDWAQTLIPILILTVGGSYCDHLDTLQNQGRNIPRKKKHNKNAKDVMKGILPCDIMTTHVLPHQILNRCLHGQNVGSLVLQLAVEGMLVGVFKPKIWICGHVHKSHGIEIIDFEQVRARHGKYVQNGAYGSNCGHGRGTKYLTVVLNASCANG